MNFHELSESVQRFGEVIKVPEDKAEVLQTYISAWLDAQVAFNHASNLIRLTQSEMHKRLETALPELVGWEYVFNYAKGEATITGMKDNE